MLSPIRAALASYTPQRIERDGLPRAVWYHSPAMKFTVILEPEADGRYSVICPAIPGCASQGASRDEALANVKEAILLCLEVRAEDSMPLPTESPELIAQQVKDCLNDRKEEGLPLTIETREVDVEAEVAV